MSGTNSTVTTQSGQPISSLPEAQDVAATDGVLGVFGGKAQIAKPADIVDAGMPTDVVRTTDLDEALSGSVLNQYVTQAATHAAASDAAANRSETAAGASAASSNLAAQTGSQVAIIASAVNDTAASAQQAVAGVTADANSAKVMLTAAINGESPLTYCGYWDANANSPDLTSGVGADGDLYIVSVAGATDLDGNAQWSVGDGAWFTNGKWVYFARAGWAAVAQSISALSSMRVGNAVTRTPGSEKWAAAWLDNLGGVIGGLLRDGSPQFPGAQAWVGPNKIGSSAIPGSGVVTLDQQGRVIANASTLTWPGITRRRQPPIAADVGKRVPGHLDDATVLFSAGDLWQYSGQLYSCLRNGAGGAVWDSTPDTAPACPGDVFGSDTIGAWGPDAVICDYVGPAFVVTTTVGGKQTDTTINILAGGRHDADALSKLLIARDTGTTAEITKLFDQSGSGNDLTGVYGKSPKIGAVTVNGYVAFSFDTSGSSNARALTNATISIAGGTFTALAFGRWAGTNAASDERIQLLTVGGISTISGINEDGKFGLYDGTNLVPGTQYLSCNPSTIGISASGGSTVSVLVGENSDALTVQSSSLGDLTGFTVGSTTLGHSCNGILTGVVLAKRAATTSDIQRANRSASLRWGYIPQVKPRLWCCGDSRTAGYINPDGLNWPIMIGDYLKQPLEVINVAVSGSMTSDFIPNTQPGVVSAVQGGGYNLAVVWLGINDFASGKDKPTVMANIVSITQALLTAGCEHVWVVSEAKSGDQDWFWQYFPAGQNKNITLLTPFLFGLPLSVNGNTTYDPDIWHPDSIHPLPAGDRTLASVIASAINEYISGVIFS